MTDEDDDRMDRARRIRRMREGRRDGEESSDGTESDAASDADGPAATNGDEPAPEDESEWFEEGDGSGGEVSGEKAGEESGDDADQSAAAAEAAAAAAAEFEGGTAGDAAADAGDHGTADAGDHETADTGGDDATGEDASPESAAAEAAAAAAQFENVEGAGEPETTLEELEAAADAATAEEAGPDRDDGDGAGAETADEDASVPAAPGVEGEVTTEAETRVLEFELGAERYCLDISYVEEIVKKDHVTRVPNTPSFVRGVVDLRGQITTILDPKESVGIDSTGAEELIVVFDGETFEDQGHIGWLVDEVRQVTPIAESEVKESPVDRQHVNGVVERDDEFVIWIDPDIALVGAEGDDEE